MTTTNPDSLEVLKDAVRRQIRAYHVTRQTYDGPGKTRGRRMHSGDDAAATAILAIIAQHYAPLVAENARLRDELNQYRHVMERLRDFDGWVGTYHAGHAYDAKQDALALLGAKP